MEDSSWAVGLSHVYPRSLLFLIACTRTNSFWWTRPLLLPKSFLLDGRLHLKTLKPQFTGSYRIGFIVVIHDYLRTVVCDPEVIWFWYCWTELPNELNKYLMHCWCGSYFTKRAVFYSHITCTLGLHMLFQYFSHKTTNSVVKVVTCQACCVLLVMCRSALTKAYWFITSQAKCLHCFWWTLHVAAFILVFVDVVCTSACFFDLPNRCAPSLCSSQNALCSSLHQTVPGLKHSQHFIFWTGACIFSVGMALASFFHFNTISVRAILFQSFLTRKRHF